MRNIWQKPSSWATKASFNRINLASKLWIQSNFRIRINVNARVGTNGSLISKEISSFINSNEQFIWGSIMGSRKSSLAYLSRRNFIKLRKVEVV